MTKEELQKLYDSAQKTIDAYRTESQKNYARGQAEDSSTPRGGPTREQRSEARRIQREIRRALATDRASKLLEDNSKGREIKNYIDNNSPNSTVFQQPPQNSPVGIKYDKFPYVPEAPKSRAVIEYKVPTIPIFPCPLGLYVKTNDQGGQEIWIKPGSIAGKSTKEWGGEELVGKRLAVGGAGYVSIKVEIDDSSGEIDLVELQTSVNPPENTNSRYYLVLGYYIYEATGPKVSTYGCGSVDVRVCRNWFAMEKPFYALEFRRCHNCDF